jgi:hypothetical protein
MRRVTLQEATAFNHNTIFPLSAAMTIDSGVRQVLLH